MRNHVYLAAMLHDIGKFYQRADTGSVATSKYLSEMGKNERDFCPLYNGQYSHKHVLWTAQFIQDFSSVFDNLLEGHDISDKRDNLLNLAAGHHLSKEQLTKLGQVIKEADCLSSGMDREDSSALRDDQDELNWDSFKKKRMVPILETIGKGNSVRIELSEQWHHLPVRRLQLMKDTFPKESFKESPDYAQLWKEFIGEFKFIQANTYHAFSETLLNLLYKYTVAIPSSTINFPDISLYDHLKTTAALALCLYDLMESGENPSERFLLIGADFSGIQSYIYQIVSKYAGVNLKGRSYYLRLLSDSVVRYLLKSLQLNQANVVYNSGGSFYLIAPNTTTVNSNLKKAINEINQKIFDSHKTSLFVAIDSVPLSDDALMHRNGCSLNQVWTNLFDKRDLKKKSRYSSIIKDNYSLFFNPILIGGETPRDRITGEEFDSNEPILSEKQLTPLKKITKDQILLGRMLRDYEVMVVSEGEIPYWKDRHPVEPAGLGFFYYFLKRTDLEKMKDQLRASADKVTVVTPNGEKGNCDFMGRVDGIDNIYALEFYGGNEIVTERVPSFEELCEKHYSDGAFKRLGVLRMDVDNLGHIFQSGLTPERASLSRYASLSRSFDFFFSGYLNTIWHETSPKKSLIIYSGGDDVFLVGSWEVTIELAKRIKMDFSEYCCDNPEFSISGGISIVPSKFPIMKAADLSAQEESRAKNHQVGNNSKNSLSILGMALNWDEEFEAVESLKDDIVNMSVDDELKKSFISKILSHTMNANIEKHKITSYKTYWMLTYDIGRMKERTKKVETRQFLDLCINDICKNAKSLKGQHLNTEYHALELWALACRWAELELRTYNL